MKNTIYTLALVALGSGALHAQQRISDGTASAAINSAAVLELQSTNKGFLPSRVALTDRLTWSPMTGTATKGMVVYNTTSGGANSLDTGLVVWEGSWNPLSNGSSADYWRLKGNAGTTPPSLTQTGTAVGAANFWGTTDAKNLAVGTNSIVRAQFDQNGNMVGGAYGIFGPLTVNSLNWGDSNRDSAQNSIVAGKNNEIGTLSDNVSVFGQGNQIKNPGAVANATTYSNVSGLGNQIIYDASLPHTAGVSHATTVTGQANTVTNTPNSFVAGNSNTVTNGQGIIMAGASNSAYSASQVVSAAVFGSSNKDSASYTLVAGQGNIIGKGISTDGPAVFGVNNTLSGNSNASIVGGYQNIINNSAKGNTSGEGNLVKNADYVNMSGAYNTAIGATYSVVGGYQNKDSASYTLVAGQGNTNGTNSIYTAMFGQGNTTSGAGGHFSVIGGQANTVSNNYNAVFGYNSNISGQQNLIGGTAHSIQGFSTVVGGESNTFAGAGSRASAVFGASNKDSASYTLVAGVNNTIKTGGLYTAVLGAGNSVASLYALVAGIGQTVGPVAHGAIVTGATNNVTSDLSATFGNVNTNSGTASLVAGSGHLNAANYSSITGNVDTLTATALYSVMGGIYNYSSGQGSAVFGINNRDFANYTLVTGQGNTIGPNASHSLATGNGNYTNAASSAVIGYSNKDSANVTNLIVGHNNTTGPGGDYSLNLGYSNKLNGSGSTNLGGTNINSGYVATAIGWANIINSGTSYGSAIGYSNTISGGSAAAVGIGNTNTSTNHNAMALGVQNSVSGSGNGAWAMGYQNSVTGDRAVAIGIGNTAAFSQSMALGLGATTTVANQLAANFSGGYNLFTNTGSTTGVSLAASGTTWASISDRRSKENINNIKYGLSTVMALRPTMYNYKGAKNTSLGFIAQEVKALVPEVVEQTTMGPNHDYLAIKYTELIPVLTKAVQEQQAEIELLKAQNAKLTADANEMDGAFIKLENQILQLQNAVARVKKGSFTHKLAVR